MIEIKDRRVWDRDYPEVRQYTEGDLSEWIEMLHAVRVALGQNDLGKTSRPIRTGEIIGLTKWPHQGRDYRPDRRQEIIGFGYYGGVYGLRGRRFGPVWHKVYCLGDRAVLAMFDYILPLSHRRFFACNYDIYEIIGGPEVVRRVSGPKSARQIADALDIVWHANNPKPEGVVLFPEEKVEKGLEYNREIEPHFRDMEQAWQDRRSREDALRSKKLTNEEVSGVNIDTDSATGARAL